MCQKVGFLGQETFQNNTFPDLEFFLKLEAEAKSYISGPVDHVPEVFRKLVDLGSKTSLFVLNERTKD
jgi:hypothetical protein